MTKKQPVDPLDGPKAAVSGRIACMDDAFRIIPKGVVYFEKGSIVDVLEDGSQPPTGFEAISVIETGGTIFPGLIELHNHLSYNALPLWNVPKKFTNRSQWGGIGEYRKCISGPMTVVGKTPSLLPAVVRYVEGKCLVAGVTCSQGIQLFSNAGIRRYYQGIVRNVEETNQDDLPEATTLIADIDSREITAFRKKLSHSSCLLLHLSEGIDAAAREHFLALKTADGTWAISSHLAGIHSCALTAADFQTMAAHGGAMVWSPLSNLMLYGATADIKAAKEAGVRIALGSDWSPSGSKNLLGELKVAFLFSEANGKIFTPQEIISMVTRTASQILGWEKVMGSIEPTKRADLLVVKTQTSDPYLDLIKATEADVRLVVINGVARYGETGLMQKFQPGGESLKVAGISRKIFLKQIQQDPAVDAMSLGDARKALTSALKNIQKLAKQIEKGITAPRRTGAKVILDRVERPVWSLALDELHESGVNLRHRLPLTESSKLSGPTRNVATAAVPLSSILGPIQLDPLTIVDDGLYFSSLQAQRNLPTYLSKGLQMFYQ